MNTRSIESFDHVALSTRNLESAARFFGSMLGLSRIPGGAHIEFAGRGYGARPGRIRLVQADGDRPGRAGVGGVHHLAFGTRDDETLLQWKRFLSDRGVNVSGPYDRGYFTSIYFRDPDGQVLEIATNGPGYLIDEAFSELGGSVTIPPTRILAGRRDEAAIAAMTWDEPVDEIRDEMKLSSIHHVSGITDDLAGADRFFSSLLGLRLIKRTINRDDPSTPHWFWASTADGAVRSNSSMTLFGWPSTRHPARAGAGQAIGIGFRVDDADDLAWWRDKLRGRGISHDATTDELILRAPDGLSVTLIGDSENVTEGDYQRSTASSAS